MPGRSRGRGFWVGHAATPAAVAMILVGCAAGSSATAGTAVNANSLGEPIATASETRPVPSTAAAARTTAPTTTSPWPSERSIHAPARPSRTSRRSRAILSVATRFADAYLSYQAGQDAVTVRSTIHVECTPAFARLLLSQLVSIPPTQHDNPAARPAALTRVTYTGPASLGPGVPKQIVIARYRTTGRMGINGQLIIELSGAGSRWRVAGLA